ncbi:MAG: hypothetical protein DWQ34_09965 [Planctomycetota bacterium]|nr:MAG: hypothetical protein DWQ34_09965 [Planctomycetota bacterium]REJ96890.1 MAG: hypothetical protein DWQ29_00595 [Planctomycetota bacterium]REK21158.1 MAG: hypothetical protein DWQ41_22355 [Planctomycetota bacterium]REK29566.1 MAG: hypothetical protein DWQ45_22390 [Planctomycetota bacterium]
MKSEHRHELAENDLSKLIGRARTAIEPHTNKILIGVLAVTVVAVGTIMMVRASGAARQEGFAQLAACKTAEDFEAVADEYSDLPAGVWARLRAAQEHLQEGIEYSLSDRAASNDRLEESRNAFRMVLDNGNAPSEAREKALYGLAMALESMAGDEEGIEKAINAYEALITEFPESRYKNWAEERIEILGSEEARDFYKWFHAQNPQPVERPNPFDTPNPFAGIDLPEEESETASESTDDGIPPPPPSAERINPAPTPPGAEGPALPSTPEETSDGVSESESEESASPEPEEGASKTPENDGADESDSDPSSSDPPSD